MQRRWLQCKGQTEFRLVQRGTARRHSHSASHKIYESESAQRVINSWSAQAKSMCVRRDVLACSSKLAVIAAGIEFCDLNQVRMSLEGGIAESCPRSRKCAGRSPSACPTAITTKKGACKCENGVSDPRFSK
mgnify:CR=1 FL=1